MRKFTRKQNVKEWRLITVFAVMSCLFLLIRLQNVLADDLVINTADAAWRAGWLGNVQAIPLLLTAAKDADAEVAGEAQKALSRIGWDNVLKLYDEEKNWNLALKDTKGLVHAVSVLGKVGSPEARDMLGRIVIRDASARVEAVKAIASIGDAWSINILKDVCHRSDVEARRALAFSIVNNNEESLGLLRMLLKDADRAVRVAAVFSFVKIGDVGAVDQLEKLMQVCPSTVRYDLLDAVALLPQEKAINILLRMRDDADHNVALKALSVFGVVGGKQAVTVIAQALNDENMNIRYAAVSSCGRLPSGDAIPLLKRALSDKESIVRARAATCLGRIGDANATSLLVGALSSNDTHLIPAVVSSLGVIGSDNCILALEKLMSSVDSSLRSLAVSALGKINKPSACSLVIAAIGDPSLDVRHSALLALGGHSGEAVEKMLYQVIKGNNYALQFAALISIRQMTCTPGISRAVAAACKSQSETIRQKAIQYIGTIVGGPDVVDVLCDASEKEVGNIQRQAIKSLGLLGGPQARMRLVALTDRKYSYEVRMAATAALGEIAGPQAIETLLSLAELSDNRDRKKGPEIAVAAIHALGNMGSEGTVPAIVLLMQKELDQPRKRISPFVRLAAIEAVGEACLFVNGNDVLEALLPQSKGDSSDPRQRYRFRFAIAETLSLVGKADMACQELVKLAKIPGKFSKVRPARARALQMLPVVVDLGGDRQMAIDALTEAMDRGETLAASPPLAQLGGDQARDSLLKYRGERDQPRYSGSMSRDAIIRNLLRSNWPDDPKVKELLNTKE